MATAGAEKKAASTHKAAVRAAWRAATNRPPNHCVSTWLALAAYGNYQDGRNCYPGVFTLMKEVGCDERNMRRKLRVLYDGHWVDVQPDGPDPGPDRARYFAKYTDPRRRPNVWCLVLATLAAEPGTIVHGSSSPFTACSICHPERLRGAASAKLRGVAADTSSDAKRCRPRSLRGVAGGKQEVSPATDIPSGRLYRPETPPYPPAGVRTDINSGAPQSSSEEVERMVDEFLRHLLTAVQDITGQMSTQTGDRLALLSLRKLFLSEVETAVAKYGIDDRDPIGIRVEEVLIAALWVKEGGAKILGKHHRLDVLFSESEFPSVSSQAESWSETGNWRARARQVIELAEPFEAEVEALVELGGVCCREEHVLAFVPSPRHARRWALARRRICIGNAVMAAAIDSSGMRLWLEGRRRRGSDIPGAADRVMLTVGCSRISALSPRPGGTS